MATPQDEIYIAVRESEGKEWIDLTSWGYVAQTALNSAEKVNDKGKRRSVAESA